MSFFFHDTATTEIYTLSLHDALPISCAVALARFASTFAISRLVARLLETDLLIAKVRSEEHTSELQSHVNLVCRLLLEKKKKKSQTYRRRIDDGRCPNAEAGVSDHHR